MPWTWRFRKWSENTPRAILLFTELFGIIVGHQHGFCEVLGPRIKLILIHVFPVVRQTPEHRPLMSPCPSS